VTAVTDTRPDAPGPTPEADVLRRMFELMTRIRRTDDRLQKLLSSGQIRVIYYSARGQECIPSAFGAVLRPDDYLVTIYRGLHDHIAKGVSLRDLWAEFLGKATGTCKGKGGPMHITDPKSGVMVTTGVVGSGLPIANGLGWAAQVKGTDQVTVVNFGDGASNIGAFHEALNLAGLWKLPVIFVCQNNGYAEHTRFSAGTACARVSDRAVGYGMPGVTVDGNDPLAMYGVARTAVDRARAGDGPTLVEALTYRFCGHVVGMDDMHYQPAEEREAAIAADPVPRYRAWMIEHRHLSEDQAAEVEAGIEAEIDDAVEFAQNSPDPDLSELHTDVYGEVSR
jgi:acetoin:2,6-dichlorophenolindophenol oxidoreductase subunit alpha